jgi:hypothetical protein
MARKTPQERLAELNEQQAKIEAELKQRRAAIVRQKQQQQAKITNEKRKADTRRKVLVGAAMLSLAETDERQQTQLTALLSSYLKRDDDRALFDLPPLSDSGQQPHQARTKTSTLSNS